MIQKLCTTRHRTRNAEYPSVSIVWQLAAEMESPPFSGPDMWIGKGQLWLDGNTKADFEFTVAVGQSCPLGSIHFDLNPCAHGALAFAGFSGTGLSERDLQWAGYWAIGHLEQYDDFRKALGAKEV